MALSFFSPMASVFPVPLHVPSARTQFAFVNMNTDANHPTRGASVADIHSHLTKRQASYNQSSLSSAFVDSLWTAPSNQDLISQFLNNNFCTTCAHGTDEECLPLYQKYSVVRPLPCPSFSPCSNPPDFTLP